METGQAFTHLSSTFMYRQILSPVTFLSQMFCSWLLVAARFSNALLLYLIPTLIIWHMIFPDSRLVERSKIRHGWFSHIWPEGQEFLDQRLQKHIGNQFWRGEWRTNRLFLHIYNVLVWWDEFPFGTVLRCCFIDQLVQSKKWWTFSISIKMFL